MAAASKKSKRPAKPKNKGGRPRKELDLEELEKLAGMGCTQQEAAGWFGITSRTMETRLAEPKYREIWENGQMKGRVSLRRTQLRLAQRSAAMAIFLGKQLLGQRDIKEIEGSKEAPLSIITRVIIDGDEGS